VPRKAPIIQDHQKVVSIIKQIGGPRDWTQEGSRANR
jgi:hypothetical protein